MSTVQSILLILQTALVALEAVPATAAGAAIAQSLLTIITQSMSAYKAATGQPLDLTKIPLETPVP